MADKKLIDYIKANSSKYTLGQLRIALLKQGYPKAMVEDAISEAKKKSPQAEQISANTGSSMGLAQYVKAAIKPSALLLGLKILTLAILWMFSLNVMKGSVPNYIMIAGTTFIMYFLWFAAICLLGIFLGIKLAKQTQDLKDTIFAGLAFGILYGVAAKIVDAIMTALSFVFYSTGISGAGFGVLIQLIYAPFQIIGITILTVLLSLLGGAIAGGKFKK